jgi:anti-sigma factor RsiW
MAIHCADIEGLTPAYLDGELGGLELDHLEHHVGVCADCRARVERERAALGELRTLLRPPGTPAALERDLRAMLDREDRQLARRAWRGTLPVAAGLAAAAALAVFVQGELGRPTPSSPLAPLSVAAVQEDAARAHRVGGAPLVRVSSGSEVARSASAYLQVPVSEPVLSPTASLRGWQPTQLAGRSAAKLVYEVTPTAGGSRYLVDVHMLDGRALALAGKERIVADGTELWLASKSGLNAVVYKDEGGIGYIVLSEMPRGQLIDLVLDSGLLRNANQRVFGK